jgi:hypothetical protein
MERVLINQDLSKLPPSERLNYYKSVCDSLGLNPLTRPLAYITLNGQLTLYARKDCTEQLRNRDRVSITIISREVTEGVYVVAAKASTPAGRTDESIGAVAIEGLKGEARANAFMKAETKAKRRVTLSICGLGVLDEEEISSADMIQANILAEEGQRLADAGIEREKAQPMKKAEKQVKGAVVEKEKASEAANKTTEVQTAAIPAPKKESLRSLSEMSMHELKAFDPQQEWRGHVIKCTGKFRWNNHRLDEIPVADLQFIESDIISKYPDYWRAKPERSNEAIMIRQALAFRIEQGAGAAKSDEQIEEILNR